MIPLEDLRRLVENDCTVQEREAAELVFERNVSIRRAAGQLGTSPALVRVRLDGIRTRALEHGLDP